MITSNDSGQEGDTSAEDTEFSTAILNLNNGISPSAQPKSTVSQNSSTLKQSREDIATTEFTLSHSKEGSHSYSTSQDSEENLDSEGNLINTQYLEQHIHEHNNSFFMHDFGSKVLDNTSAADLHKTLSNDIPVKPNRPYPSATPLAIDKNMSVESVDLKKTHIGLNTNNDPQSASTNTLSRIDVKKSNDIQSPIYENRVPRNFGYTFISDRQPALSNDAAHTVQHSNISASSLTRGDGLNAENIALEKTPTGTNILDKSGNFHPETLKQNVGQDEGQDVRTIKQVSSNTETITIKILPFLHAERSQGFQPVPSPSPLITTHIGEQLIDQITQELREKVSSISDKTTRSVKPLLMQLTPAELGRVHIQFSFDGHEHVSAKIIAESPEVSALLKQKSDVLFTHLKFGGFDNIDLSFGTKNDSGFSGFGSTTSDNQQTQIQQSVFKNPPDDELVHAPKNIIRVNPTLHDIVKAGTHQLDLTL
jgi:hypothetical protein